MEKTSGFDLKKARENYQKKVESGKYSIDQLYNKACGDFDRIISMIITKYKPTKIYQWGSLLNRDNFSEISDIDIAVEGINSAEEFFSLYGDALDLTSFSLDVVQLEKIEEIHAQSIIQKGKLIYEKN